MRRICTLPLLWFLLAAISAAASSSATQDADELFHSGMRLLAEGRPDEAIATFRRAIQLRPGDAVIWKALGAVYASKGDYQNAEEPFHRACLLNPATPDACLYFGRTLYLLDRFEPALNVLHNALEKDAQNAQLYRIEALSLEALGRSGEAEAAFQQAIRLNQAAAPNEDPGIDYGVFLYRAGRAEEALAPLQAAIKRHSEASRAHLELGCVLLALDRVEQAAAELERAVTLDPKAPRAHLLLGKAYLRLGKTGQAQQQLDQGSRTVR